MTEIQHKGSSKNFLKLAAIGATIALGLVACSSDEPGGSTGGQFDSGNAAYDKVINNGPLASEAEIKANAWASKIKEAGVLKVGGTETSTLFSLLDPVTGIATGFDAGITQLLSRYILGEVKTELTQVTVATREELVVNNQVDLVTATYSITPARLEKIDFSGPYYSSYAGILVKKDNTDINSVEDLKGKRVTTQEASTGVTLLESLGLKDEIIPAPDNAQALLNVQQGRADAYVIDQSLLLNAVVANNDVKIVGQSFGNQDPYGIGVNKNSDAKEFINAFLTKIYEDGSWLELWKATIQAKTDVQAEPTPPVIGSAGN